MARFTHELLINALQEYTFVLRTNLATLTKPGLQEGKAGVSVALFEAAAILQSETLENEASVSLQKAILLSDKDYSMESGKAGVLYAVLHLQACHLLQIDYDELLGEAENSIFQHICTTYAKDNTPESLREVCSYAPLLSIRPNQQCNHLMHEAIEKLFALYAVEWEAWIEGKKNIAIEQLLEQWHKLVHQAIQYGYTPSNACLEAYLKAIKQTWVKCSTLQHLRMNKLRGKREYKRQSLPLTEKHPLTASLDDLIALHLSATWTEEALHDLWLSLLANKPDREQRFAQYTTGAPIYSYRRGAARIVLFLCWLLQPEGKHKTALKQLLI